MIFILVRILLALKNRINEVKKDSLVIREITGIPVIHTLGNI